MNTQNLGVISFMKYKSLYLVISLLLVIPGTISLIRYGLRPSIDFTGGTLLELALPQTATLSAQTIIDAAPSGVEVAAVQPSAENTFLIRSKPMTKDQNLVYQQQIASIAGILDASSIQELRFETVGPTLGRELLIKTYTGVALAAVLILLYIAYRFHELRYGVCAIVAMFHDSLILLGAFSLLGHFFQIEVDTLFVTAVLTTLSFSVHDTIVVYDRIRESRKRFPGVSFSALIDKSIHETLSRSINNSMTIIFMLSALALFGGQTITFFVVALLIGTIIGTYSSPFVASPLLLVWDKFFSKKDRR